MAKRSFRCKQEFSLDAAQPFDIRPPYLYFTDVDQAKLQCLPQSILWLSQSVLLEVRWSLTCRPLKTLKETLSLRLLMSLQMRAVTQFWTGWICSNSDSYFRISLHYTYFVFLYIWSYFAIPFKVSIIYHWSLSWALSLWWEWMPVFKLLASCRLPPPSGG